MNTFRRATVCIYFILLVVAVSKATVVLAQSPSPLAPAATPTGETLLFETAEDPSATGSATPDPLPSQRPPDITQNTTETRTPLARYLAEHPMTSDSPLYFIQRAIRNAVDRGVPPNILVLLLLFPVTASMIAIFRHVIGLRGFGVYTPAVLAVAFISTGISRGVLLFGIIFAATMLGRSLINRLKLQYLPRAALLLWAISMLFFGMILISPYISIVEIATVSIFPLLVLILLSENFLEAQAVGTLYGAFRLTAETLFLAILSTLFMRTLPVQQFVIIHPEITIFTVLFVNIIVGKYTGLRITEILRFKTVLDPEE